MRSRILASVVRKKRDGFIYLSVVNVINKHKVNEENHQKVLITTPYFKQPTEAI
jgi:hypothetical protein